MTNNEQFVTLSGSSDSRWGVVLPVLQQLREDLTLDDIRGICDDAQGQRPTFTALFLDGGCVAVAGWRVMRNTHLGKVLYIDDLVVDAGHRSRGYGAKMLEMLKEQAKSLGVQAIDLDSGVQRHAAHRFYMSNGFIISSYHFRAYLSE